MVTLFSFLFVLGVLIFVHELGHFIFAKIFGVGVEKFSLGFGPRILGKTIGITDYRISAIPLGGYVKMVGEDPDADIDLQDIPVSFTHKSVYQRILIVAAGPVFNFLLAIIIFFGFFQIHGTFYYEPIIGTVKEGSPAHKAGFQEGDKVVSINGSEVKEWSDMTGLIASSKGTEISVSIKRDEAVLDLKLTPALMPDKNIFGEDIERYMIGITNAGSTVSVTLNPFQALTESFIQTYKISELTLISVVKLVQGKIALNNLGGPIFIAETAGDQARAGIPNLIFFIALISVNLAIINLFPIPVLDGGHLLFFAIEAIRGEPVNIRAREIAQQFGLIVLLMLMGLVIYIDIMRKIAE